MAPVENRLTISLAVSTSSRGTGFAAGRKSNNPRIVLRRWLWSFTALANSAYFAAALPRTACCRLAMVSGVQKWSSPRSR